MPAGVPLAFAHRGFAPDGDENTMAAFERAVGLGYRYLETDVRATSDGVAVVFHDASLHRLTDRRPRVDALRWDELRHVRVRGREPIPRLDDLLAAWPDVRINLDVKAESSVGPMIDSIRRTNSVDRVCVGAFSARRIDAVRHALGPRLCTSLGPRDALAIRLGRRPAHGRCTQVPPRIGAATLVDASYLAAAHAMDLQVHAWTINRTAEMHRLLDLGVDGIMTDRADALRAVLMQRGQWHG